MKIQLKSGSNYEIVNSSGTTLLKVDENGQITGGGTKLYNHDIYFGQSSSSGSGSVSTQPLHLLCSIATPISLEEPDIELQLSVGVNCAGFSDDDGILGSRIYIYRNGNEIVMDVFDYKGAVKTYSGLTNWIDEVTPL